MGDVARLLDLRDRLPDEWAGLLTRAASAVAVMETDEPRPGGCRGCDGPLPPQGRGRPRKWCPAPECQRLRKNGSKSPAKRSIGP